MASANDIITGAFGKAGIYQPEDTIPPEDVQQALAALNDYLNGLNARGAVFETVELAANDVVPVSDQNIGDLKMAMVNEMASQWGKKMNADPELLVRARQADRRFVAAYTTVPQAVTDAGLGNMPSRRRW